MPGRDSGRGRGPSKGLRPTLEGLDRRVLLSWGGAGPALGSYVAPASARPRPTRPAITVDPHNTVNHFLGNKLGPGVDRISRQVELDGPSDNRVAQQVLAQGPIHSILTRQDTYTLLNSALTAGSARMVSARLRDDPELSDDAKLPLTTIYAETGPLLLQAIQSGMYQAAPNAPRTVPGLRLVDATSRGKGFSSPQLGSFLRSFRAAADRHVFDLSARQSGLVLRGYDEFEAEVTRLSQAGAFTPPVPLEAPELPSGRLGGTVAVSLGSTRALGSVDPERSGLQWPGFGNFAGRIDVGYVFDRSGNFGIYLSARGPLSPAPAGVASADVIGGDIRVEVSNAPNLASLNGVRTAEGVSQGSPSSGGLEASRYASGIATLAASAGYGAGFEFGTGVSYTKVIPLGNVHSLIPEFPGQR